MRLRTLFHEVDEDRDGAIDEHQLRHLLRTSAGTAGSAPSPPSSRPPIASAVAWWSCVS
jgi:hypothetical protein